MTRIGFNQARMAALATAISVLVAACGVVAPPPRSSPLPSPVVTIDLGDGVAGIARTGGRVILLVPDGSGGVFEFTSAPDQPGTAAVHLATFGGDSGRTANSFVFGNAPSGASRVEVAPGALAAAVRGGVFLVALEAKDLLPADVHWTFFNASGAVVSQGRGITG
jgi:hypothetical protein